MQSKMPKIPEIYNGLTFQTTDSQGGYGYPSTSMYDLGKGGYATFGALGQGEANDLNIDVNERNEDRTMIVTVMPGAGFTQGTKKIKFEIGAYPWNKEHDMTIPQMPFVYGYTKLPDEEGEGEATGANKLLLSSFLFIILLL